MYSLFENNEVLGSFRNGTKESKLPKEDQLREYFNQFILEDPYNHPKMTDWAKEIKDALNFVPDPDDYYYDEDEPAGHAKAVDVSGGWVGNSFRSKEISPDIVPPDEDSAMVGREFEDWFNVPVYAKNRWNESHDDARGTRETSITKGGQLSIETIDQTFRNYRRYQLKRLVDTLKQKGFTKKHCEPELQQEILTRQKQFPGQQIFCLLGNRMVEYFQNIHGKAYWNNALLIRSGTGYYSIGDLNSYESAVFAHCQVRASHNYLFYYDINRVPRRWAYRWISIMEYSLEVDERIEEAKKQIHMVPASLARFTAD